MQSVQPGWNSGLSDTVERYLLHTQSCSWLEEELSLLRECSVTSMISEVSLGQKS